MVVGYHHVRKPPYASQILSFVIFVLSLRFFQCNSLRCNFCSCLRGESLEAMGKSVDARKVSAAAEMQTICFDGVLQ